MSDPWREAVNNESQPPRPTSGRRTSQFLLRLLVLTGFVLTLNLAQGQTLQEGLGVLALTLALSGLLNAVFAMIRREPVARGGMNGWDEALMLIAASRAAHMMLYFQI